MEDTLYGRLIVTDSNVPEGIIKMHPETAAIVLRVHRMRSVPVTVANVASATKPSNNELSSGFDNNGRLIPQ